MFSYMFVFMLLKTVWVFWRSDTAAEKDEGVPPSSVGFADTFPQGGRQGEVPARRMRDAPPREARVNVKCKV